MTMWKIHLFLATHLGFYKTSGVWWMRNYPQGQVQYPDGISAPMPLGNAVEYAQMFNGKVVQPGQPRRNNTGIRES